MSHKRFWLLVAVTTGFEGLRAGAGLFRALLDLPARSTIGPVAFAQLSRATDLSPRGVVFYVLFGFGGLVLTAATWIVARRSGAPRPVRRLAGLACLCSLAILAMTTQAAPLMFRVGSAPDDPAVLASLLDRFTMWTDLRILAAIVSFAAMLTALTIGKEKPAWNGSSAQP
jgi:hypothetical protein